MKLPTEQTKYLKLLKMQTLQCQPNLFQVEQTLTKHAYFSRSPLPGFADGVIYRFLVQHKKKEYPDKKIHPNFYHWYVVMRQFADSAREGWIREKRYIDNQSQKCLMLIADIFARQGLKALHSSNRNKSVDTTHTSQKLSKSQLMQSAKLKPIDMNNKSTQPSQKAEYRMIVQLRHVENIEELFKRFYKLKQFCRQKRIKLKQLNFHNKHEKSVFLRFVTEKNNFQPIKEEINGWIEVRRIISKESMDLSQGIENKKVSKAVSIR